jgi:hypothetical protein
LAPSCYAIVFPAQSFDNDFSCNVVRNYYTVDANQYTPTHLHPAIASLIFTRSNLRANGVDLLFELPAKAWVDSLVDPTLNLFLFELVEKSEMRNANATLTRGNGLAR